MANKNKVFDWFDSKNDCDQLLLLQRIKKERDRYANICCENEDFEEQVRISRMEDARSLRESQSIAENRRKETLLELLANCIPSTMSEYNQYCQEYLNRNPGLYEWDYLKIFLPFFKLHLKSKKLPAAFFTVSNHGQKCSTDSLREKLLRIM